ncbi:hypothetical protein [Vibrio sp. V04_P4A5T148]|uniref:hypothetical protein n=3 Tax=unclassified Vibrio TaxID=2614977 RepID=UPI000B8E21D3|nr:hypothetical protein [Vibrio sp. V04_P4A5T148]OXX34121.1 hypothetical protein B9J81_09540 [Vibrio sp. V04_P4A5T148]
MIYKIIFLTLLFFSSIPQAAERMIYGNFVDTVDEKYSFYSRDLKDFIEDLSYKNYHLSVDSPQNIGPKGNLINRTISFYICEQSLINCLKISNQGISLTKSQIKSMKIKASFPNDDVSAGSYSTSFVLSLTSIE